MNHSISEVTVHEMETAAAQKENAARACREAAADLQARADEQHQDADTYAATAREYRSLIVHATGQPSTAAEPTPAERQAAGARALARLVADHPELPMPDWHISTSDSGVVGHIWDHQGDGAALTALRQWADALAAEVDHNAAVSSSRRDAYQLVAEYCGVTVRICADAIKADEKRGA